jgi:carboxyl-terminal processing protease
MLPASNRGPGQSLNFPDVCKTPAPPAPFVPVPYPDIGMNMQAAPFSPFVFVQFIPATNMGTLKVMTMGDEAGAMGGLVTGMIKGPGKLTVGNPIVFVTGLPAENLALPTSGNAMNAPVGAQIVPSVVNVTYTYRHGPSPDAPLPVALNGENVRALHDVAAGDGGAQEAGRVRARWLDDGVASLTIALFSSHTDREVFNALRRLGIDDIRELELDLRGNPGGDTEGALRLASAFLPRGTIMLRERAGDGDEEEIVARGEQSYRWPLRLRIDGATASAAELLVAALQHVGRATVVGQPSYGKATAQRAIRWPDGTLRYVTVSQFFLPCGAAIDGCGVTPDEIVEPTHS